MLASQSPGLLGGGAWAALGGARVGGGAGGVKIRWRRRQCRATRGALTRTGTLLGAAAPGEQN